MPNHVEYASPPPPKTEEQLIIEDAYNTAVLAAALKMKAEHDAVC